MTAHKKIKRLKDEIMLLGKRLLKCNTRGFKKSYPELLPTSFKDGDVPRCLYLEEGSGRNVDGCIIVGMNPGRAEKPERKYYKNMAKGLVSGNYALVHAGWKESSWNKDEGLNDKFYRRSRNLARSLGYTGPIFWNELVKWNLRRGRKKLKIKTIRDHVGKFLVREISIVPRCWPIIALGKDVFQAVSFCFPERKVIGVPHPTGSSKFINLFMGKGTKIGVEGRKLKASVFKKLDIKRNHDADIVFAGFSLNT